MNLTSAQNALLSRLEEQCKAKDNPVWVGTWADMLKLGGSRDLLNGLEQGSYIAPYMQTGDYWTVMPTRKEGLQRLAIQARYTTYCRRESDTSNDGSPILNEGDGTPTDENKQVMCQNCPNQKMTEVTSGYWECPTCDYIVF